ncbi:HD-GYP domain-containing protein [Lachnospiraceae bacterium ZAX-1]
MPLGQDIYDVEGRLLLAKNLVLTKDYIRSLRVLGFAGVYCGDAISKEVEPEAVIRPMVQRKALKLVHDFFTVSDDTPSQESLQNVVAEMVDDAIKHGDVMCNLINLKTYDDYTYYHCVNVSVLAAMIGTGFKLGKTEMTQLTMAALLHDVGKRFLNIEILNAQRNLTKKERKIIQQHPVLAYDFLKTNYDFPPLVYASILQHHEFFNGKGYPDGASGDEITLYARIIKVADVFDALTTKRPYHEPSTPSDTVEYIVSKVDTEFDRELVDVFLKKVAVYPTGCEVVLSNGQHAIVLENYQDFILRPKVKVIGTNEIMNLKEDRSAQNVTVINLFM